MLKHIVCTAGMALAAMAAPLPLSAPQVGIIRDASHRLRPVYGFSANLITGDPLPIQDVRAASFSTEAGIVLTPGAVKLIGLDGTERGSYETEEPHPVLSISGAPDTAVAWLPSSKKLIRWNGSAFTELPFDSTGVTGVVAGLQMTDPGSIDFFIQDQDSVIADVHFSLADGRASRVRTYERGSGQAVTAADAMVMTGSEGLEVQSGINPVESVALPDSGVILEKSSSDWIHVSARDSHRQWMLHIDRSHPVLSELPPVQPVRMPVEAAR
jgi:hypothetical protein